MSIDQQLQRISGGEAAPVYLVTGDLVLAERAAVRLAEALAEVCGCSYELHRRPGDVGRLLADLRTFSLFATGKVVLAVDTAVLADRKTAAQLVAEALAALPLSSADGLSAAEREAGSRLLQALHVFDLAVEGEPAEVLAGLPDWALTGGRASKKRAAAAREKLAPLLEAALAAGLEGIGEGGVAQLADAVRRGLPPHHALVLAERAVAADHPLVGQLAGRGALVRVGTVEAERGGGWRGVEAVAAELERELGTTIDRDAVAELAKRTLRQAGRSGGQAATADSTARFAAEMRKLADLAGGGRIDRRLVEESVDDRGEEDVWKLLDAVSAGRRNEAVERLDRLIGGADDPIRARLGFFGLLAAFCRQLVAIRGAVDLFEVPTGVTDYRRFRDRIAPQLQRPLPEGTASPLAGLHPFRLHRAYLAASKLPSASATRLPARVLETELAIKGESHDPDAALAALVTELASL